MKPAPAGFGIRFRRSDIGGVEIPARIEHLAGINYATALSRDGASVETIEHLLAALVGLGVDNAVVELNHREVPIMDGSAAPFAYLVNEAGLKTLNAPRRYMKVVRPVSLSHGEKRIAVYPADQFKLTYAISFDHPLLRHQARSVAITTESFVEEVAPARTFGFLKEVEMLRQNGLALGGSLENAIVLGETGILNNTLRFEDEFVRHKILDAIGDIALAGAPLVGHVVVHRGGHAMHTSLVSTLVGDRTAWRMVDSLEPAAAVMGPRAAAAEHPATVG